MHLPDLSSDLEVACAWSAITEPGDEAAGLLRAHMGSASALEWVLSKPNPAQLPHHLTHDDSGKLRPWTTALKRWLPRLEQLNVEKDLEDLYKLDGWVTYPEHSQWPLELNDLGLSAPSALWVRGRITNQPRVAIVGARASTNAGNANARELAADLARAGVSVVSGGAFGIDATAHSAALSGHTIAVMAGGVAQLYPRSHLDLFDKILQKGAIISESPPSWRPARWRFLSRNRLIAAYAHASIVVEASLRSGALVTIRHARDLNRPVGAFPGPVTSSMSQGCHRMIREGVTLVTNSAEVVELVHAIGYDLLSQLEQPDQPRLSPHLARVYDAMPAMSRATAPSIARAAGLGLEEVSTALATLMVKGHIDCEGEEFWRV